MHINFDRMFPLEKTFSMNSEAFSSEFLEYCDKSVVCQHK